MSPDPPSKERLRRSIVNRASRIHQEPLYAKGLATPLLPLFRYDQSIWKTSSRVMHDYERGHGQHFQ